MTTAGSNFDRAGTDHFRLVVRAGAALLIVLAMEPLVGNGLTAAAYGQAGWRPVSAACQSAMGSGSAEDNLSRLRSQSAQAPEIASAITACETKVTRLRQDEQQLWVRALEAKKNWDCTDSRRQFKALAERASFYQLQASSELKKLGDCGEQIVSDESADLLLQHAQTAYKSRDFRSAREQAWRIVGLKNSLGEQARSLLKDIEEIEIVNDLLRRADRAFRIGKVNDACSVLLNVQETHPAFPNMAEVRTKLSSCPSATAELSPAAPKTELDKQVQGARAYIAEGNLELASARVSAAAKRAPNDKDVTRLRESFQAAKQARELLDLGVNLIYQARYSEAANQLAYVVTGQTSPGLVARAHFYIGVAMAHEFYLRGNGTLKSKAVQEFQNSANDFIKPDFDQISPKIKQLYDEAVGN